MAIQPFFSSYGVLKKHHEWSYTCSQKDRELYLQDGIDVVPHSFPALKHDPNDASSIPGSTVSLIYALVN